jgi:endonuclease/exonuclease/phosphatase family metal-dependent hydrolase
MIARAFKFLVKLVLLVAFALCVFLFYIYITDFKPGKSELVPVSGRGIPINDTTLEFSFLSWNIGYAGLDSAMDFFYDGGTKTRTSKEITERNLKEINKILSINPKPDFILLQEVDQDAARTYYIDEFQALAEGFKTYETAFVKNYDVKFVPMPLTDPMGKVIAGLATFSKYQPVESKRIALPGSFAFPTNLFMLDRCYHLSKYNLGNATQLVIINTHNTAFDDGSQRLIQARELMELAINEFNKGNFVVIGGDFNTNPPHFKPDAFAKGYLGFALEPELTWEFPTGWTFSFDSLVPSNRDLSMNYKHGVTKTTVIDFFITSPNIKITRVKTIDLDFKNSDHQPVILNLSIVR